MYYYISLLYYHCILLYCIILYYIIIILHHYVLLYYILYVCISFSLSIFHVVKGLVLFIGYTFCSYYNFRGVLKLGSHRRDDIHHLGR